MSDNVLETIRATVQDFLAPELKTHGVRLENLERRLEDTRHSLEQRQDDMRRSLEQKVDDTKDVLRAEIKTFEAKVDGRFSAIDSRFATLEGLIKSLIQQITFESGLRERVASLEARMPKQ